jgi:hypothetical protein
VISDLGRRPFIARPAPFVGNCISAASLDQYDARMIRTLEAGDRAGIALAVACALHCLMTPVLATSLQIAGVIASERTEFAFLGVSLLISGMTVVVNCLRRRASAVVWATFVVGAALLLSTRVSSAWAEPFERPLVVVGAGMIVVAHVINLVNCHCRKEGPTCVQTAS